MAYNKNDNRPRKAKRAGVLWKPKEQGNVVLSGYLDLGMDAKIQVQISKNLKKSSEKSPDYLIEAMVPDWQAGGNQGAGAKAENAGGADEDVPF